VLLDVQNNLGGIFGNTNKIIGQYSLTVEHIFCKDGVGGSNPSIGSNKFKPGGTPELESWA
jgi:hypothetical protein